MKTKEDTQASDAVYGCVGALLGWFLAAVTLSWPLRYVLNACGYHAQYWVCVWTLFAAFWLLWFVGAAFKRQ